MRIFLILLVLIFTSCSSFERAYENSLTAAEKQKLDTADYLIRSFRIDYEKGRRSIDSRMRVTKEGNKYVFTPVDSLVAYTSDGVMLEKNYYDKLGQLTRMMLYTGTQPNQLITDLEAHDETLNGKTVRYEVIKNGFFPNGQPQTIERWMVSDQKRKKHGKWEFYNADGSLLRTVTYESGKRVN